MISTRFRFFWVEFSEAGFSLIAGDWLSDFLLGMS